MVLFHRYACLSLKKLWSPLLASLPLTLRGDRYSFMIDSLRLSESLTENEEYSSLVDRSVRYAGRKPDPCFLEFVGGVCGPPVFFLGLEIGVLVGVVG